MRAQKIDLKDQKKTAKLADKPRKRTRRERAELAGAN